MGPEPAEDGRLRTGQDAEDDGLHRAADGRAAALDHGVDLRAADLPALVEHRADGAALRHVRRALGDGVRGADRARVAHGEGIEFPERRGGDDRDAHDGLAIDLFFVACDYITIVWGNVPRERAALDVILPGGSWQWLFWVEWIIGGVVPFLLLVVPSLRRRAGPVAVASVLAMVGVYAYRIELVVAGMVRPLIQFPPGIALGTSTGSGSNFQFEGLYHPTWVEYSITVGLLALVALLVMTGHRWLRIGQRAEQWTDLVSRLTGAPTRRPPPRCCRDGGRIRRGRGRRVGSGPGGAKEAALVLASIPTSGLPERLLATLGAPSRRCSTSTSGCS